MIMRSPIPVQLGDWKYCNQLASSVESSKHILGDKTDRGVTKQLISRYHVKIEKNWNIGIVVAVAFP